MYNFNVHKYNTFHIYWKCHLKRVAEFHQSIKKKTTTNFTALISKIMTLYHFLTEGII